MTSRWNDEPVRRPLPPSQPQGWVDPPRSGLLDDGYLDEPPPPEPAPRRLGCSAALVALILALSGVPGVVAAGDVTRAGTWAYAKPSFGPDYLAIPEGPRWHVTVCGPKGCIDRVSTDAGPALYLQRAGRIGDLASSMFLEICGPLSAGLCRGFYTITGAADQHGEDPPEHPADASMRLEDRPLPATSTEDSP